MSSDTASERSHCSSCGQLIPQTFPEVHPSVQHLLRTYYTPVLVDPVCTSEVAVISALEEDINHYTEILERLKHQRDAHLRSLTERQGLRAPVRRLPTEILAIIIKQSLSKENSSSNRQLISLSHVSYGWRMTVFSNPILWQRIQFRSHMSRDYISWILEKSSQLPLLVDASCRKTHPSSYFLDDAFDQIMAHSWRWKSLSLDFLPNEPQKILISIHGRLPLLESLNLGAERDVPDDSDLSVLFSDAPSLKELHVPYPLDSSSLRLPWRQLTTLSCEGVSYRSLHEMLEACHCLDTCRAINLYGPPGPDHMVTLHRLTVLTITIDYEDAGDSESFFPRVTLPTLSTVVLTVPEWWDGSPITSMLKRSSPQITDLTLLFPRVYIQDVIDLVGCLPALLKLDLHITSLLHLSFFPWMEILAAVEVDGSPSYLPKLQHLRILLVDFILDSQDESTALASIVNNRCKTGEPSLADGRMPRCHLTFEACFDSFTASREAVAALMALQDEGFNAHVYSIHRNIDGQTGHSTIFKVANAGITWREVVRESETSVSDHEVFTN